MNSDTKQEIATPKLAPMSVGGGAPVPLFATSGQKVCCAVEANTEVCIDPLASQ